MSKKTHHDAAKDEKMAEKASELVTEQPTPEAASAETTAEEQQIAEDINQEQSNFEATVNELNL